MAEYREGPERGPRERVEHTEVYERTPADAPTSGRRSSSIALIVIPLVLVALLLLWYVLSRAEPTSPLEGLNRPGAAGEVESPAVDVVDIDVPVIERVEAPSAPSAPAAEDAPATPPDDAAAAEEPAPADPGAADPPG